MLDHGEDMDYVRIALELGFSAVMIDGSSKPYDENVSLTREAVALGLYIVKTILNNHKENISVTSQDGVTEFVFTLTLA